MKNFKNLFVASFLAIALGTMSGGWKIVKTMGTRITKVTPLEGVSAETAGAITLFLTEHLGIPVSTTHTITGSIIGVGATKRLSAVRWGSFADAQDRDGFCRGLLPGAFPPGSPPYRHSCRRK